MRNVDIVTIATLGAVSLLAYGTLKARSAARTVSGAVDNAQLGTTDFMAEMTGLAQYERDLLNANSESELNMIRSAWDNKGLLCGYKCQRRKQGVKT